MNVQSVLGAGTDHEGCCWKKDGHIEAAKLETSMPNDLIHFDFDVDHITMKYLQYFFN